MEQQRPTAQDAYTVVRTVAEQQTESATCAAIVQKRQMDNGQMSREFVTIRCSLQGRNGTRTFFLNVNQAGDLVDALSAVTAPASDEAEELRRKDEEARLARDQQRERGSAGARQTGKTAKDKAKDSYKPPARRKAEKSAKDQEIRQKMRSGKQG